MGELDGGSEVNEVDETPENDVNNDHMETGGESSDASKEVVSEDGNETDAPDEGNTVPDLEENSVEAAEEDPEEDEETEDMPETDPDLDETDDDETGADAGADMDAADDADDADEEDPDAAEAEGAEDPDLDEGDDGDDVDDAVDDANSDEDGVDDAYEADESAGASEEDTDTSEKDMDASDEAEDETLEDETTEADDETFEEDSDSEDTDDFEESDDDFDDVDDDDEADDDVEDEGEPEDYLDEEVESEEDDTDTESDEDDVEDTEEDTESDEDDVENTEEDAEFDEDDVEGTDEDTESDDEAESEEDDTFAVVEDAESDENDVDDANENTESDDDDVEDADEDDNEDADETDGTVDESTDADETDEENPDEEDESEEDDAEDTDKDTESDDEIESEEDDTNAVEEDEESNEDDVDDADADTESDEEDGVDTDVESDVDHADEHTDTEETGDEAVADGTQESDDVADGSPDANENIDGSDVKTQYLENVAYSQGNNDFGAQGTCGETSISNALNRLEGGSNHSENEVVTVAMNNGLCSQSSNPTNSGGTSTQNVVDLIDRVKDPESGIHTEVYDYGAALDTNCLADRVASDDTVAIVGVDSSVLWGQDSNITNSGAFGDNSDHYSDHWIVVDCPVYDENGELSGFNIIDSGGGESYADKDKFEKMYRGTEGSKVLDPTAVIVTKEQPDVQNTPDTSFDNISEFTISAEKSNFNTERGSPGFVNESGETNVENNDKQIDNAEEALESPEDDISPEDDYQAYREALQRKETENAPENAGTGGSEEVSTPEETVDNAEDKQSGDLKPLSDKAVEKCRDAGLSDQQVHDIRVMLKGEKPDPSSYLSENYIDSHLDKFRENGTYKFISDKRGEPHGTIGEGADDVFVLNGKDAKDIIEKSVGDPGKLEESLGMEKGYLGDNPYIVRVDDPQNLRMPTGNEHNAWQQEWCPCGTTRGGCDEAVIDPVIGGSYSYKHVFEAEDWKKS